MSGSLALAPLGFLALATRGGALVELTAAGLGEDPGLLNLLVETAKRGLERLAFANDHFRQRYAVTRPSVLRDFACPETKRRLPEGRPTAESYPPQHLRRSIKMRTFINPAAR